MFKNHEHRIINVVCFIISVVIATAMIQGWYMFKNDPDTMSMIASKESIDTFEKSIIIREVSRQVDEHENVSERYLMHQAIIKCFDDNPDAFNIKSKSLSHSVNDLYDCVMIVDNIRTELDTN